MEKNTASKETFVSLLRKTKQNFFNSLNEKNIADNRKF